MHKLTRACQIPMKVKREVFERDGGRCVGCGRWAYVEWACAHLIPRSHGGLGVPQNILTLCPKCHSAFDSGAKRRELKIIYEAYIKSHYDEIGRVIYKKGDVT